LRQVAQPVVYVHRFKEKDIIPLTYKLLGYHDAYSFHNVSVSLKDLKLLEGVMKNRKRGLRMHAAWASVLAIGAALMFTAAHATVLTNIQGSVMVDRGSGFQSVSATSPVAAGDRVRAVGGSADIVYDDGIVQKVAQSQTVAVLSKGRPDVPFVGAEGGLAGNLPVIGATLGVVGIAAGVGMAMSDSGNDSSGLTPPVEGESP
jgi:hypothetical protein